MREKSGLVSGVAPENSSVMAPTKLLEDETRFPSGLRMRTLKAGDATNYPTPKATCRIHYEGRLEGEIFDSSRARNEAVLCRLGSGQLIKGLDDGIQTMSVGQVARFIVPPSLAYGEKGYLPVIPPNATLTYDLELIAFDNDDDDDPS